MLINLRIRIRMRDFEWRLIADLNRTISLMLAHAHCVVYYFHHARGRHRITP